MDKKTVHLPGIAPGGCLLFLKYPVWTGYFRRNRQKVKGIMKKIVKILRGIGYLAAFSLILYPVVSNYINQMNSTTIATDYEQEVSHLSEEQENAMIEQAQEYNESLIGIGSIADPFSESNENQTENDVYNNLLKIDDTGMMGYIDIPKLDVVLPVYHGTSEKVLQSGVGHLKNTSLPVGGESCHAVLSGHRGLANAKIFTDLNKMEVGDVFYIKVLHHTFAYQVDQILTVLPSDTDALQIEKGKDYVTLVTCTPYAVNTHRLLVRGTRIPYEEAQKIDEEVGLQCTIPFNLILLIAGIVAFIIIWVSIKLHKRRKEKKTMQHNIYLYIMVSALVSFAVRAVPLTLIRKKIENPFLKSFLFYVPYVTLSVMTFPAIVETTAVPIAGVLALIAGIIAARKGVSMFLVAVICCVIVFAAEMLI